MPATASTERARTATARQSSAPNNSQTSFDENWRASLYQSMQAAAKITGVSPASLYRLEAEGKLKLRRLAGRTLVETASLIALADMAEPWTASQRGDEARRARVSRARAAWQD
ncbi:MAG: hypothetical protein JWL93_195 [Hyphomicrobiales bacterium]|nr:hypothetical protein [Hyphomicrobiales bacterium]